MIWSNYSNKNYYDELTLSTFEKRVKQGGLDTCPDIDQILKYIITAKHILDVGAGYGRVINYLLFKKIYPKIDALERSYIFCEKLKLINNIKLIEQDLLSYKGTIQYDCILFMMNGIGDFSEKEQSIVMEKLMNWLAPYGFLIIESLDLKTIPIGFTKINKQEYSENSTSEAFFLYIPTLNEIRDKAMSLGGKIEKQFNYKTTNGRLRNLSIITKD